MTSLISGIELYSFLGVEKYAAEADVRAAYKKLSLKVHPDKNLNDKNATEDFKKLHKVYETLMDADKRAAYDKDLRAMEKKRQSVKRREGEKTESRSCDEKSKSEYYRWMERERELRKQQTDESLKEELRRTQEKLNAQKEGRERSNRSQSKDYKLYEKLLNEEKSKFSFKPKSFKDVLIKYAMHPSASIMETNYKNESRPEEVDRKTGLPIKYVYSHGADTVFACAATFSLPVGIRLRGDDEVIHNGFIVRLWPSERAK